MRALRCRTLRKPRCAQKRHRSCTLRSVHRVGKWIAALTPSCPQAPARAPLYTYTAYTLRCQTPNNEHRGYRAARKRVLWLPHATHRAARAPRCCETRYTTPRTTHCPQAPEVYTVCRAGAIAFRAEMRQQLSEGDIVLQRASTIYTAALGIIEMMDILIFTSYRSCIAIKQSKVTPTGTASGP